MPAGQPAPHAFPHPTEPLSSQGSRPLRPEHDPFFEAPAGYETTAPGTLLRSREIQVALFGRIPQKVAAWQLLYRSTNLHGAPEVTVTTVLLPSGADPAVPRPLIAYQAAIDAVSSACFPSYALRRGSRSGGAIPAFELFVMAGLLRHGWALSVADHEGLGGAFGAAREPGYRALDGVRAALAFEPLGLTPSTPIGIIGYSGGGMAASWAAEMAPTYAPELDIVGAVLGAPVGDPGQTFLRLNGGRWGGLPATVVAGIRGSYPGLAHVINQHATLEGQRKLKELEQLTTTQAVMRFRHNDFDDYVDAPLADILARPEVLAVFDDLRLGHTIPTCPLLVVQGVHDQLIHIEDVDAQVQRYVDGGATVLYLRDQASEHVLLQPLATPTMTGWLADRFAGRPAPKGTRTVLSVSLSLRALKGYAAMAAAAVRSVLAKTL